MSGRCRTGKVLWRMVRSCSLDALCAGTTSGAKTGDIRESAEDVMRAWQQAWLGITQTDDFDAYFVYPQDQTSANENSSTHTIIFATQRKHPPSQIGTVHWTCDNTYKDIKYVDHLDRRSHEREMRSTSEHFVILDETGCDSKADDSER